MPKHAWQREQGPDFGRGQRECRATLNRRGLVRKYGINVSRRTFREIAQDLGFKQYD